MKVLTKKTIKKMKKKYGKKLDKKYKKYKKEQKEKAKQEKNLAKMNKRVEEFGYAIDESKILKELMNDSKTSPFYILLTDVLFHQEKFLLNNHRSNIPMNVYHPYCKDGKILLNVLESDNEKIDTLGIYFSITFIFNKNIELHEEFTKLLQKSNMDDSETWYTKYTSKTPNNIKVRDPYCAYTVELDYKAFVIFMKNILEGKIPNYLQFTKYSSHSIRVMRNKGELIGYALNDFPEIS